MSSAALAVCHIGQFVETVGVVVVFQMPPTAKGFAFLTLEDEFSMINVIVQPALAAQLRRQTGQTVRVEGTVQHEDAVTNVVARIINIVR